MNTRASKAVKPVLVAMLTAILLTALMISSQPAGAAASGITFTADKLVYHPGETVSFTLYLDSAGQSLSGEIGRAHV